MIDEQQQGTPYTTASAQIAQPTTTPTASPYKYAWQGQASGQLAAGQVNAAYQHYLGRDANHDELWNQHLNWDQAPDQNFMGKILGNIANSPAAKQYSTSQAQSQTQSTLNNAVDATKAATAQPAASAPVTGSPVTANGQIPAPAPAVAPPMPAQAPQAQPAGATAPDQLRYVKPVDLSAVPGYHAMDFSRALPAAYQPGQISQFTAPNQSAMNGQQSALMSSILTNPQTLSPSVVAQMKEQQKEQALLMERQNQGMFDQSAVAHGTLGNGNNQNLSRENLQQALNAILSGNRGIDVNAAQTNRADELGALQASESLQQGQLGRATSGYNTTLQGQTAHEAAAQAAAQSALQQQQFGFNVDQASAGERYKAQQDTLNRALQQFQMNQGVASNAQQNYAQDLGAEFGRNSSNLDLARYLEGMRQFNDTMGLNLNQLNSQDQRAILAAIGFRQ